MVEFRVLSDPKLSRSLSLLILTATFFFMFKLLKNRTKISQGLNLPGVRRHFLGGFLNLLEMSNKKKTLFLLRKWCNENGPIFRADFGLFPFIVINSPKYIRKIYGSSDLSYVNKPFMYDGLKFPGIDSLITSTGDKWKSRRKMLNPLMDFKSLKSYLTIMNEEGSSLIQKLENLFPKENLSPKEINKEIFDTSLRLITRAILGADFEEFDKTWPEKLEVILKAASLRALSPWLLLKPIWNLHPLSKKVNQYLVHACNKIKILVDKVKLDNVSRSDSDDEEGFQRNEGNNIIKHLLSKELDLEGICEESIVMISAGYETTAQTIHLTLFLLALNPEVQENCRQEIDAVFDNAELCPGGNITYDAIQEMKCLERCIMESLRINPIAIVTLRKILSSVKLEEDLTLPSGTYIIVVNQGIHMNPELYPDPDKFDPDRFLKENIQQRDQYAYIPFSAGPRMCIGYKFAMLSMSITISKILRQFVVKTVDTYEDVVFRPDVTLRPETPIRFILERRHAKI